MKKITTLLRKISKGKFYFWFLYAILFILGSDLLNAFELLKYPRLLDVYSPIVALYSVVGFIKPFHDVSYKSSITVVFGVAMTLIGLYLVFSPAHYFIYGGSHVLSYPDVFVLLGAMIPVYAHYSRLQITESVSSDLPYPQEHSV